MKKANKLWQPSILDMRLKPDWEAAAPLFEKAAVAYKVRARARAPRRLRARPRERTAPLLACGQPPGRPSTHAGQGRARVQQLRGLAQRCEHGLHTVLYTHTHTHRSSPARWTRAAARTSAPR